MTVQQKKDLIELMQRVHGVDYTLGWLTSAYCHAMDPETEDKIVTRTQHQLLLESLKRQATTENKNEHG